MLTRRTMVTLAAVALAAPVGTPPTAQDIRLPEARAAELARQVLRAGTWDEQRAAFERLTEPEQVAVWRMLTDVRPGPGPAAVTVRRGGPAPDAPRTEPAVHR